MKWYLIVFLILLLSCASETEKEIQTYKIHKGKFIVDIVETGEVNATSAVNISSPFISWRFGVLKIIDIADDGLNVTKDDTVMVFDPSEVHKVVIDVKANLEIARAEYTKVKAEQQSRIEELEANLEISEINLQIAQIELDQASFEAEITRKEIQLNLDKAKINLNKIREEIKNQKEIQKEEMQRARIRINQLENELEEAYTTLEKLTVLSPASGVIVIRKNRSSRTKWQEGDQPWPGQRIIMLPDLSELKAETKINEVDISKITIGQKTEIRLDAYADEKFTGKITSIATLATFKNEDSKIKIFPVEMIINETSEKLLPGMTVSCRIMIDQIDNVLFVPHEAIFENEDGRIVFLKKGNEYKEIPVVTGQSNNDYIIIREGLKENDIVALNDPREKIQEKDDDTTS